MTRLVLRLYRCLLAFYPSAFRHEFGAEMTDVFTQALAAPRNSAAWLFWRELCDWPGMVWRIHLSERSTKMTQLGMLQAQPVFTNQPVPASTWHQAWIATLSFLLILWETAGGETIGLVQKGVNLPDSWHGWLYSLILFAILAIDLVIVLLGWWRGWPRWSLPYLGVILALAVLLGLAGLDSTGAMLIIITPLVFLLAIFVTVLGRWWKPLHSLYAPLRKDWTLLGLVYYSCLPLPFAFMLDETRNETSIEVVLYVILALGVLVYMRSTSLWRRVLVLPGAYLVASLAATMLRGWVFQGRQTWLDSDTFRLLITLEVVAIIPLLIVGIYELWRYASNRGLQTA